MDSRAEWRSDQYRDLYRQRYELGGMVKEKIRSRPSDSIFSIEAQRLLPPADVMRNPELVFPFWYNPANPQVRMFRKPPAAFMRRLFHVNPDLPVTWDPVLERWCVWAIYKKKRLPWWMRPGRGQDGPGGWWIIMVLEDQDGNPIDVLDNRTLATLFFTNQEKYRSAGQGAVMVERALLEEEQRNLREDREDAEDEAGEQYDYMAIKNYGQGNKSHRFHSGG